jgi:hypothetical protein
MRFLVLLPLLALMACYSSQLARDLRSAESSCDHQWPSKTALVECLDRQDRAVWSKEEPATLDLYQDFAQKREALAMAYDRGQISESQYHDRLDTLKKDSRAQMQQRRGPEPGR